MESTSHNTLNREEDFLEDFFIFGYGSLIWNPGFEHAGNPIIGFACEHVRRFYQGSQNFRGTPEWPGRVATLVPISHSRTWGLAYRVTHPASVIKTIDHLIEREMVAGEYQQLKICFHPFKPTLGDPDFSEDINTYPCCCYENSVMINAITYIANTSNSQYIGPASIDVESFQIFQASGIAGTNTEYVEKIGKFHRDQVPNGLEEDPYLKEIMRNLEMFKNSNFDMLQYVDKIGDSNFNKNVQ